MKLITAIVKPEQADNIKRKLNEIAVEQRNYWVDE